MAFKVKQRPYFDESGNWHIPNQIPSSGELQPKLKPHEWFYWLLLNSDNVPEKMWKQWFSHRTTQWRIKNKLREKGYL